MSEKPAPSPDEESEPLITDKRRVDPETGDVRADVTDMPDAEGLSPEDLDILDDAERDLVAEYRDRAARAGQRLNSRTSGPGSSAIARLIGRL